ncbi:MAG: isocitrate/isopropylmalate dehydrogenase family protein [archaeon]
MTRICVIRGDGIGSEVIGSALRVLDALNLGIGITEAEAGYDCYRKNGTPVPEKTIELCRASDAILLGAVTTPTDIPNYRSAIVTIRRALDLYANIRPVHSYNIPTIRPEWMRKNVDMVIIRENTEGLYSGVEHVTESGNRVVTERIITKRATERIMRFAFEYAKKHNRKKVTIVHKANILRESCGLFRRTGLEVAKSYPSVISDEVIVDAMAMRLIKEPERFDIIVASNMMGDILSDEASMLCGGLGLASSANIGPENALFEPVHGSAPKYAGKNVVNPVATILALKLMLEYLGMPESKKIDNAVREVLAKGERLTKDLDGNSTTTEITDAIIEELK